MYDADNIFARILRNEISCQKEGEDEFYLAFRDLYPKTPIHILIIPKGAYITADDFHQNATADEIVGFYRGVASLCQRLGSNGYRLISNVGKNGGQEVPHFHLHMLSGKLLGSMTSY
jgi:histidine triad (HIT) family protein